jgi:thymidylate synthase
MNFEYIRAYDIPSAWRKTVSFILHRGEVFVVKKGSECTETKKLALTIHITNPETRPLVDDKCITTNMAKVNAYALRYLWADAKTKEEEYTYGSRLRDPVDQPSEAIRLLAKEPNNRQVTLVIRVPDDIHSPHPPCLTIIDLEILDKKLNSTCYFRSWDAFAGLPENIAGIQIFAEALVSDINHLRLEEHDDNKYGEEKPEFVPFTTGDLILHSKNCHLYKRQYDWAEKLELSVDTRRMSERAD